MSSKLIKRKVTLPAVVFAFLFGLTSDHRIFWKNVSSLTAMDQWSPWKEKDPEMKNTLTGTDGTKL